jgi:hypothetical protein
MNIFGDPWSFPMICSLFTYLMLFTKRCQDYYYPISYLISMVSPKPQAYIEKTIQCLKIHFGSIHKLGQCLLIATKQYNDLNTPGHIWYHIYGATHLQVTCKYMQLYVHN